MQENGQNKNASLENIDEIVGENLFYRTFFNKDADYYDERYKRITASENVVFNAYNNTGDQLDNLERTRGVSVVFFIRLVIVTMMLTQYAENSFY